MLIVTSSLGDKSEIDFTIRRDQWDKRFNPNWTDKSSK